MVEVQKEKKEEELKKEELKEQLEAKKEEKQEKKEEPVKKEEKPLPEKDPKDKKISFLFKHKPLKILLLLLQDKQWYSSLLARESGQSYVHATKIIASFEDMEIISSELAGKKRVIKLTEKGEKIARALEEIIKTL